ncbi:MAG: hypothetical protein WD768_19445 [Phycisphaeraceae bacterium]
MPVQLITIVLFVFACGACESSSPIARNSSANDTTIEGPRKHTVKGSLIPFTDKLREQYQIADADMTRIQFYVSAPITLRRQLPHGAGNSIAEGRLKYSGGGNLEEVFIERQTPGRPMSGTSTSVHLRFNPSLSAATLEFNNMDDKGPSPDGFYRLSCHQWDASGNGKLMYNGAEFNAVKNSAESYLLVEQEGLNALFFKTRQEPGELIPELQGR